MIEDKKEIKKAIKGMESIFKNLKRPTAKKAMRRYINGAKERLRELENERELFDQGKKIFG